MAEVGAQASAAKPAELTLKAKAEDKHHHPEVRRHLHCRVQGRRRRGAGDLNPKDRGDAGNVVSRLSSTGPPTVKW
jgi:hypothetical protein